MERKHFHYFWIRLAIKIRENNYIQSTCEIFWTYIKINICSDKPIFKELFNIIII
jgi:hypothetical protein